MKNLKSIIAILAITLVTSFSANATEIDPSNATTELRLEIVKILGDQVPVEIKKNSEAKVSFMLNNKNELVVISVDSEVDAFNSFVKNKLNYKKVKTKGLSKGEVYKMPVKLNSAK